MSAYAVVCQRRSVFFRFDDFSVRYQSQFDQRLESVADTQHQAVSLFQEFGNRVRNGRIPKYRRDKFCGTIRFISAAESPRNHDDLALSDLFGHLMNGLVQNFRRQIRQNLHFHLSAGSFKCAFAVHFTVGSRENRNKYFRSRSLNRRRNRASSGKRESLDLLPVFLCPCREYTLQRLTPRRDHLFHGNFFSRGSDFDFPGIRRPAYDFETDTVKQSPRVFRTVNFCDQSASLDLVKIFSLFIFYNSADFIARRHFTYGDENTAASYRIHRQNFFLSGQFDDSRHILAILFEINHAELVVFLIDMHQSAARFLEFGRDHPIGVGRCDSKGNQRRRHIDIHKSTGHAVLSADGRDLQFRLSGQASQQRAERLAPSLRIVAKLFKILLKGKSDFSVIPAQRYDLRD